MKRILKRIIPFMVACAVVVFAACQETQAPTPTEPGVLEGRGGPTPQSQINQAINKIFSGNRSEAHEFKSAMFDAVGDDDAAAAEAAAGQLASLALNALQGDTSLEDDVQILLNLLVGFAGLPPVDVAALLALLATLDEDAGVGIATPSGGGIITTDPSLGVDLGFGGVEFEPDDLPETVVVIVTRQEPPCLPANLVGQEGFGCFSFRTDPELAEFDQFVTVGVCLPLGVLPPGLLARVRLFEADGPFATAVELLDEVATPDFLVTDCTGFLASTESSWLENFANAGWDKVGRPLASLLAPEPLHAATVLATSGSLGGRTKNFSNIAWADPLVIDDGFEVPSGWAMTGFWHRSMLKNGSPIVNTAVTDGLVNDLSDGGDMPAPFGGDWVFWYGDEDEGNYIGTRAASNPAGSGGTSTTSNSGTLTSPIIAVPEDEALGDDVILRFDAWFEIESVDAPTFDIMRVSVEEVGGPTTSLGVLNPTTDHNGLPAQPFSSGGFNVLPVWFEVVENLNAFRGKDVRLIFTFNTGDGLYNGFRGWLIDNVQVGTVDPDAPAPPSLRAAGSGTGGLNPSQPARPRD